VPLARLAAVLRGRFPPPAAFAFWIAQAVAGSLFVCGFLLSCEGPRAPAAGAGKTSGGEQVAAGAQQGAAGRPRVPPCPGVKQAARTFIGFAKGQNLDDFEATATEAERVLRAVKTQLCRLDAQRDNGLRAGSLTDGGLLITAVKFTSADLSAADVELKRAEDLDNDVPPQRLWLVRMQRSAAAAWSVLLSRRPQQ
jgi:hypothetical protein